MENQPRHTEMTMYHHTKFNGESTKAHKDDNVSSHKIQWRINQGTQG